MPDPRAGLGRQEVPDRLAGLDPPAGLDPLAGLDPPAADPVAGLPAPRSHLARRRLRQDPSHPRQRTPGLNRAATSPQRKRPPPTAVNDGRASPRDILFGRNPVFRPPDLARGSAASRAYAARTPSNRSTASSRLAPSVTGSQVARPRAVPLTCHARKRGALGHPGELRNLACGARGSGNHALPKRFAGTKPELVKLGCIPANRLGN